MNNLCPAPWISKIVHSDGTITPCCYTYEQDIEKLKRDFLNIDRPTQCQYCWRHEDNNLPSPRQDFINFSKDSAMDSIELLSLNLGNYCNAECIICNGNTSSKRNTWARKNSVNEFIPLTISVNEAQIDFDLYPKLKMVTLIGGEPMIHPKTKTLLKDMINSGLAKNIIISFNTNASIFDQEIVSLLGEFKSILVTLSIDGAGKYFEYQRRPLSWDTVKEISLKWMDISESIIINYVVSAVSIWGYNEFIEWYNQLPIEIVKKDPQVIFVHVNDKQYLTLNVLTDEQKNQWIEHAVEHKFKQSIVDILASTKFNSNLVKELFSQIELEDISATTQFADLFPNWK